jgi:hypothetical protein
MGRCIAHLDHPLPRRQRCALERPVQLEPGAAESCSLSWNVDSLVSERRTPRHPKESGSPAWTILSSRPLSGE